jgi:hypothetical protein
MTPCETSWLCISPSVRIFGILEVTVGQTCVGERYFGKEMLGKWQLGKAGGRIIQYTFK